MLLVPSILSADTIRVYIKLDSVCGHIEIRNQTTGEMSVIHIDELTGDAPSENKYVLAAREYLDSRGITRSALTKFIFKNLADGATIDLRKYENLLRG